ncbi:unnamed protein product, partial [Meganyctiphanes norvegica]
MTAKGSNLLEKIIHTETLGILIIVRMNMNQDQFLLKWNNHQNNFVEVFSFLRAQDTFVDVTLACDGKSFPAHKVVLSACSPYFQTLFQSNPCKHPIVFLKDVKAQELDALIEFIYKGEVSVCQSELASLISTAENLKIKGLAEPDRPIEKGIKRLSSPPRNHQSASVSGAGHTMAPISTAGVLHGPGPPPPHQAIKHHGVLHKYPLSSPSAKRKRLDTSGVYTTIGNIYSSSSRDNELDLDDNIEANGVNSEQQQQQHLVVASGPPQCPPPSTQVVLMSAHELPQAHQTGDKIPGAGVHSYSSHHQSAQGQSQAAAAAAAATAAAASSDSGAAAAKPPHVGAPREDHPHFSQSEAYLSEEESTIPGPHHVVQTTSSHTDSQSHAMNFENSFFFF